MIAAALYIAGAIVLVALIKAGADRLFNHVDVRKPDDDTTPDPTATGNGKDSA